MMHLYRFVLAILFCICCLGYSNAQGIRGRVVDHYGNPMTGVNCRLLARSDSTYVAGTTTNPDGCFGFKADVEGEYIIQLSFIGFEKVSRVCRPGDLGEIILTEDPTLLEEVVIKGDLKHQDAMTETFFLTDSLRNSANNSLQLLNKLEGISVDWASDAVKIGEYRDVAMTLNGRDVGRELIQNLNPRRIKKIELLRYPKGKYGDLPIVLNLVTYDNYLGYEVGLQAKGLLSLRPSTSHSENIGADFIYTLQKLSLYGGVGANDKKMYEATAYSYIYKDEVVEATAKEDYRNPNEYNTNRGLNVNLGMDYKIASGHTLSLQSWLDGGKYSGKKAYLTLNGESLYEGNDRYRNINSTSGIYYRGALSDRFIITSDLTYNHYNINEHRSDESPSGLTRLDYTGRKNFWRYNLNVNNVWNKILTGNVGYTYTDKSYLNRDSKTGEELFRSFERRHDVYASLMVNPHPKVSISVGSNVLFVNRDNGLRSDSRCSWMPSAKLYWQAPGKISVTGNYFCNVDYPNLDQLSTVRYNKNQILMFQGNPDLRERIMHYMEWRVNIPKIIEFTYMLKHSANDITPWYFTENDYVVETLTGSKYLHQYIGLSGDYDIGQRFQVNFTANYQWYGRRGSDKTWHKGCTWYLDAMATYRINASLYFLATYFLRHDKLPLLQGEEYSQEEMLMLGIMSPLCKGKLSLAVNFALPTSLVSKRTYTDIAIPDFKFTSWKDDRVNNALVQVSVRYNFGKGSATKSNNQNRSESEKSFE